MSPEAFERGFKQLAAVWPDRSPSAEMAAVYAHVLGDMSDDVWAAAIHLCLTECTFFPVPAEIVKRADRILSAAGMLPEHAEEAWSNVLQAARSWGDLSSMRAVGFSGLLIDAVQGVGGMMRIALANEYAVREIREEFIPLYTGLRLRAIREDHLLRLSLPRPDQDAVLAIEASR